MGAVSFLLPKLVVYHLFRNILAVLLVIILYYFIGCFIRHTFYRKWTLVFLIFSSGWAIYFKALELVLPGVWVQLLSNIRLIDFKVPETSIFLSMSNFPLFSLALVLLLLIFIFFLKYFEDGRTRNIIIAGMLGFILGFVHLYEVITVYAILAPFLVFRYFKTREIKHYLLRPLAFYAISLVPMLYHFWVVMFHESYYASATVYLKTNPIWDIVLVFGVFSFFCMYFGITFLLTKGNPLALEKAHLENQTRNYQSNWMFLVFWIIFNLVLLYAPLPPQLRFIQGLRIPVVVLGSVALFYIIVPTLASSRIFHKTYLWLKQRHLTEAIYSVVLATILVIHIPATLGFLIREHVAHALYTPYYYVSRPVYEGFQFIKEEDLQGTILSNKRVGNWIPTFNGNRVFKDIGPLP